MVNLVQVYIISHPPEAIEVLLIARHVPIRVYGILDYQSTVVDIGVESDAYCSFNRRRIAQGLELGVGGLANRDSQQIQKVCVSV